MLTFASVKKIFLQNYIITLFPPVLETHCEWYFMLKAIYFHTISIVLTLIIPYIYVYLQLNAFIPRRIGFDNLYEITLFVAYNLLFH